jgi:hypothetical protein
MTPTKPVVMKALLLSLAFVVASISSLLAQATFQLDKTSYAPGETIVSSWTGSTNTKDWIGIYPRGIVPDGNPVSTSWGYVTGASGSRNFTTPTPIGVGEWTAWFLANDGYGVMPGSAPVDFAVVNPNPQITGFTSSTNFAGGAPVTLSWTITNPGLVTSLTIEDGTNPPVDVIGQSSLAVNPAVNTTYVLKVNGGVSTADRLVMVAGANSPAFSLNRLEYEVGQQVQVSWSGATANPDSWIGIYKATATPRAQVSDQWNYLNGTRTAGGSVPEGSMQFNLPAGLYYIVLFTDEGYLIEQGPISFSVVQERNVKVSSVVRTATTMTIEWHSRADCEYDVYATDTLAGDPAPVWELLELGLPTTGNGTMSYTETLPQPAPARRFYKVYEFSLLPD